MIKRTWFFHIESLATLVDERRANGKITRVSGFVSVRSFFVDHDRLQQKLLNQVEDKEKDFNNGEYMLVSMSRV